VYTENEKNVFLLAAVFYYKDQDTQNYSFACCFFMSVRLAHSHWGRNVGWKCLRMGCWGRYLDLRGTRRQWGAWRLHNGEPDDVYPSPNVFWVTKYGRMRWAGHVARTREGRGECRTLVGRSEGKRPFERPRRRLDNNIKVNLQEVRWGGMDWLDLGRNRCRWCVLVNAAMSFRVP